MSAQGPNISKYIRKYVIAWNTHASLTCMCTRTSTNRIPPEMSESEISGNKVELFKIKTNTLCTT